LVREVDRIFFLQLVNLSLELEFVTFLSRDLMLLNVLKVQRLLVVGLLQGMMSIIKELDLQSLIQIFLTPRLRGYGAMAPASLLVDLFDLILL
jgi:hypothetical protein